MSVPTRPLAGPSTRRIPARPTMYRGIRMRSRLEARVAGLLDQLNYPWEYEPYAFADGATQYLPDFRFHIAATDPAVYLEVKPYLPFDQIRHWQQRMEIIWASEPNASLLLFLANDEGHSEAYLTTSDQEWFHTGPAAILGDLNRVT